MDKKYEEVKNKFLKLEADLQNPAVVGDPQKLKQVSQDYTDLKEAADKIKELENLEENIANTELMASSDGDDEMRELAAAELLELRQRAEALNKELQEMVRPKDPMDKKDVIIEIRAGVGGDESALFAANLFRMYSHYA